MRISSGQITATMLASLQMNYGDVGRLEMQLSSGKKILKPSDDPIGSVSLLGLKKEQKAIEQYQSNITQTQTQLSQGEVQLDSMVNILMRVQDLTQMASNDSYSSDERIGMATELRQLHASLLDLANAKDENGSYLFSGSEVNTTPVVKDATGNYSYQGDAYQRQVAVAHGVTIVANNNASDLFFSGGTNFFQELDGFISTLETAPGSVNTASGLMLDTIAATQDSISIERSGMGARQNTLEQLNSAHSEMKLFSEEVSNKIETLDYSEATTEMSSTLMALQVTMQAFSKVNNLSLFNYL